MNKLLTALLTLAVLWTTTALAQDDQKDDLKVIYSSLNDKRPFYQKKLGGYVNGKQASKRFVMSAMPFTPTEDATIREIRMALVWVRGVNAATVSLHTSNGNIPGDGIDTFHVADLPKRNTCCELAFWPTKAIPVKAGTRYWLVARGADGATLQWQFKTPDEFGLTAFRMGGYRDKDWAWQSDGRFMAFSVLGE